MKEHATDDFHGLCVYIIDAQVMDNVYLNFRDEDADHIIIIIIIIILLLLFTFTLRQIQKMHYVFTYICI